MVDDALAFITSAKFTSAGQTWPWRVGLSTDDSDFSEDSQRIDEPLSLESSSNAKPEPQGRLLGQRGVRVVLRHSREGAAGTAAAARPQQNAKTGGAIEFETNATH